VGDTIHDDEIVGIAGEAIDGALRPHGIGKGGEPFVGPAIRRHDNRSGAVALQEEVAEVATLDRIDDVNRKVVGDQEVDATSFRSSVS
jgi:hypothetical protein